MSLMSRIALRGYDSRYKKPMLRFAEPSGEISFLGREIFGSGQGGHLVEIAQWGRLAERYPLCCHVK